MTLTLGDPFRCKARTQARVERRWVHQSGIEMRIANLR
jgi:hypothetical protein